MHVCGQFLKMTVLIRGHAEINKFSIKKLFYGQIFAFQNDEFQRLLIISYYSNNYKNFALHSNLFLSEKPQKQFTASKPIF